MANNQKPSLFKLYVDAIAERDSLKYEIEKEKSSTHRFFEMLAERFITNETDEIIEN